MEIPARYIHCDKRVEKRCNAEHFIMLTNMAETGNNPVNRGGEEHSPFTLLGFSSDRLFVIRRETRAVRRMPPSGGERRCASSTARFRRNGVGPSVVQEGRHYQRPCRSSRCMFCDQIVGASF